jgi:tetratricopeptide (TPR) repeat protein
MTAANRPTPAVISELFTQYLKDAVSAREQGLAFDLPQGEVVPYEAAPVQPVDPRLAWEDCVTAARLLAGADVKSWPAPQEWPALVAAQEPAVALAFCVGNFPQMVRNLQPLLSGDLTALRVNTGRVAAPSGLAEWAAEAREPARLVTAAAALRLARQFDEAEGLLKRVKTWPALVANEQAALAWQRGRFDEAAALWRGQAKSAPVLFNRGMAALFLGDAAAARADLNDAGQMLPETSAWHLLGRLYQALADSRG